MQNEMTGFRLRLEQPLHRRAVELAAQHHQSLNGFITSLIERSLGIKAPAALPSGVPPARPTRRRGRARSKPRPADA